MTRRFEYDAPNINRPGVAKMLQQPDLCLRHSAFGQGPEKLEAEGGGSFDGLMA